MQNGILLVIIAGLIALMLVRMKWKSVSPAGVAAAELRRLTEAYHKGLATAEDLVLWEKALTQLEGHPSEYNKLEGDIHFIQAFAGYLEKHFPEDTRLESLRKYAGYRKDSIWGIHVKRD